MISDDFFEIQEWEEGCFLHSRQKYDKQKDKMTKIGKQLINRYNKVEDTKTIDLVMGKLMRLLRGHGSPEQIKTALELYREELMK